MVKNARAFHPPEAAYDLTGCSEKALVYMDFDTEHAYVIIAESSALHHEGIGASIVRGLAWDNGIRYTTTETVGGEMKSREIEKPGPTGLITTTTRGIDSEVSTRMLWIDVSDTAAQTRAVLLALAMKASGGAPEPPDFEPWHAAQQWLAEAGCKEVLVPFAEPLAIEVAKLSDGKIRMRRDFEQILTTIQAHAFLHQRTREKDVRGRVCADERDYEAAYGLLSKVLAGTVDNASDPVRETVDLVARLWSAQGAGLGEDDGVTQAMLIRELGLDKSSVSRRVKKAVEEGYLINIEERRGRPHRLIIGDPMPAANDVLPTPRALFGTYASKSTPAAKVRAVA